MTTARILMIACALAGGTATGLAAPPGGDYRALVDFFANHGCTIGPVSRKAARAAGFQAGQIDLFVLFESARDGATVMDDWLVMAPSACTISPPRIGGELRLSDPDIRAAISAPDAYAAEGSPGCFLGHPQIRAAGDKRGWDDARGSTEFYQLLARSIIAGDASFYSPSLMVTPPGHQVMIGDCANVPDRPDIRRSSEFLIRNFDPIVRGVMAASACDGTSSLADLDLNQLPGIAAGTQTSNAWAFIDLEVIAVAAGWQADEAPPDRPRLRPPMCHLDPAQP